MNLLDCPDYDGVPEYGGPCWTCQNDTEHCPLEQALARANRWMKWATAFMVGGLAGVLVCVVLTACMVVGMLDEMTWVLGYLVACAAAVAGHLGGKRALRKSKLIGELP
jgi:peptidoglycan/LPS O-acetylase OafA/YrhL